MTKESDAILKEALDRISEAYSADLDNREEAEKDLRFIAGDQWPEEVRLQREAAGKPILTINHLAQFVRSVTGQIRQINPAIKVMAGDNKASSDVAEVMAGLIRQIEYASDGSTIYEGAAESAAACGIGNWRILTRYCDGETFDQEIYLKRIHNPFAVIWDPLAKEPNRSDARFVFVVEDMAKEDFEAAYPDAVVSDATKNHDAQATWAWTKADAVSVAEYMTVEHRKKKIYLLPTGEITDKEPFGIKAVKQREVMEPYVRWVKISGDAILEGPTEMPTPFLPVVAVTGEEWHIGETVVRSSVIRNARDPQQLYNFARSSMAEIMAMQPKAPWLVTTKQVAKLEGKWALANSASYAYLEYNPDPQAPPPQRIQPPVSSQAVSQEVGIASDDMKRTTGIYDASLGAQGNEKSGVAIRERNMAAQIGNSIYADNMVKAIAHTGRILVEMIPRVYDSQRIIRILGEDDQEQQVVVNALVQKEGVAVPVNDLTVGKYAVKISVGPTYASKRQETVEGMAAFVQAVPAAGPLLADLLVGAQDWPEADRASKRLRKALLPQGLEKDDDTDEADQQQPPDPAQMAAQQGQMAAQEADLKERQAKAAEAEAKAIEAQAKAQMAQIELQQAQMTLLPPQTGMVPVAPVGAFQSPMAG